jgi:hypothetical protein
LIGLAAFFQSEHYIGVVPDVLTPREQTYTVFLISILSLSFLLVSLSRNMNSRSIGTVLELFFRDSETMEAHMKENMRIGSVSSVVLLVNFFVSFALCNFIFFHRILLFDDTISLWLAFGTPLLLFLTETLGVLLVGILSGELKRLNRVILNTFTISQFAGVFFTLISLFWIMNPGADKLFLSLYLAIVALKEIARLLKSSIAVLVSGVSWYYLILYFCTLEILPLFVVIIYVLKNFLK